MVLSSGFICLFVSQIKLFLELPFLVFTLFHLFAKPLKYHRTSWQAFWCFLELFTSVLGFLSLTSVRSTRRSVFLAAERTQVFSKCQALGSCHSEKRNISIKNPVTLELNQTWKVYLLSEWWCTIYWIYTVAFQGRSWDLHYLSQKPCLTFQLEKHCSLVFNRDKYFNKTTST